MPQTRWEPKWMIQSVGQMIAPADVMRMAERRPGPDGYQEFDRSRTDRTDRTYRAREKTDRTDRGPP